MAVSVSYPDGSKQTYSSSAAAQQAMASKGYSTYTDRVNGGGAGTAINTSGGGGGGGSYTGLRDMINGGGPGASGSTFQGGALSGILNSTGIRPLGSAAGAASGGGSYTGLRDMVNGGGPGAAGPDFQGGGFMSTTLNRLGVPPIGSGMPRERAAGSTAAASPSFPAAGMPSGGAQGGRREPQVPITVPPSGGSDSIDSGNMTGEEVSRGNAERSRVPTYEAGGYIGKDGKPIRPSTETLDLPPALTQMLFGTVPSYAEGGMVGPGGVPQRPMAPPAGAMTSPMAMNLAQQGGAPVVGLAQQGKPGRPLNFAAIDQQAQQFMQQNPQQVQQIRSEVERAMAAGEVDASSLNMFVQIATTALQNPEMWPQLRQVLIRQGMLDAEDVGEEYDQGFLIVLYIIGKTMGNTGAVTTPAVPTMTPGQPQQGAQPPMSAGQAPQMSMATGGPLPAKSENPDGSIPINAHEGEYVIPADVTRKLGTDHFDKLIAKARGADGKGEQ